LIIYSTGGSYASVLSPAQQALIAQRQTIDKEAQDALDRNDLPNAEYFARQGEAIHSYNCDDILSQTLYLEGKTDEAFIKLKEMVEQKNGDDARWLLPYAVLELKAGNYNNALMAYNKATLRFNGQYKMLNEHNNFDPNNPQPNDLAVAIHVALAITYHQIGSVNDTVRTPRSLNEYKQALAIEPNSPLAQNQYAHALVDANRYSEAGPIFKNLSATATDDIKSDADDALSRLPIVNNAASGN
jgi:tetratricopeptide (TPR) repeat protein